MAAIPFLSLIFYPHLTSLAAAAYARTRKPDDQGEWESELHRQGLQSQGTPTSAR